MKTLIALFLLLLPAATAAGQEIAGDWQGTLTAGPAELRLVLHVTGNAGTGYRATMDSPDQNVTGMPVEAVSREGTRMTFALPQIGATFEGTLHESGQSVAGTWSQGGASLPLELSRRATGQTEPVRVPRPGEMDGSWSGTVQLQGQPLEMVFRIVTYEDGFGGTLDVPAHNASGLPISQLTRDGDGIRIEMRQLGGTFEGTLDEGRSSITGVWRQPGFESPLVLRKAQAGG